MDGSVPRVLLTAAYRWPSTARLALALSEAGLTVEAVCLAGHPLARMTCVTRWYRYSAMTPIRQLRNAIIESSTDLIIPSDDTSASQLHELYRSANGPTREDDEIRSLIARSLGDPTGYPSFYSRSQIAAAANAVGVLSPATKNLHNYSDLVDQLADVGLPAVLKIDGSFGGMGVEIVHTRAEAKRAFAQLGAYNSLARAIKRLIVDGDANVVLPGVQRTRPQISIQRFLRGERANSAVACWKGTVLAQVCVEVTASREATGPASVVRVIKHPIMSQAVERLVGALGLSGLCGFDFILDSNDGSAHMIDFNPRATQTCHLISSDRTQPTRWLAAKLQGRRAILDDQTIPQCELITLFPHWLGNFTKGHSVTGIDPSSKSPELVEIGLEFHRRNNRLLARAARLVQRLLG
jgi:ATP-grasp domain